MIGKSLLPDIVLYECTIIGCGAVTTQPHNPDPRKRWIIGLKLKDDDGKDLNINLCPPHVRRLVPGVDEDFFDRTENTEEFVRIQ